jgi:uncharacterized membrane protein YphA (DoxX/SURF4 family)
MPTGRKPFIDYKHKTMNISVILPWILRILAAVIMLQTLYFKFTGAAESVYIFSKLGMEPWGRIGTGVMELIASLLILYPKTTFQGAVLACGLMTGAIISHLFKLGISVQNDGGQLFIYAMVVFASSLILVYLHRQDGLNLIKRII